MLKRIVELCWCTRTTVTDALDWLDKNQLAELKGVERASRCGRVPLFQPESVAEGRPDRVSATTACWSYHVLLTSLASKVQSS